MTQLPNPTFRQPASVPAFFGFNELTGEHYPQAGQMGQPQVSVPQQLQALQNYSAPTMVPSASPVQGPPPPVPSSPPAIAPAAPVGPPPAEESLRQVEQSLQQLEPDDQRNQLVQDMVDIAQLGDIMGGYRTPVEQDEEARAFYEGLTPEQKQAFDLDRKIAGDMGEIQELQEYYKDFLPYRDMFGRPRQNEAITRSLMRGVPYVGALSSGVQALAVGGAFRRLAAGEASKEDLHEIARFKNEMESMQARDDAYGWIDPELISDIVLNLPAFMLEFGLASGPGQTARLATMARMSGVGKEVIENVALRRTAQLLARGVGKKSAAQLGRKMGERTFMRMAVQAATKKAIAGGGDAVGARLAMATIPRAAKVATTAAIMAPFRGVENAGRRMLDREITLAFKQIDGQEVERGDDTKAFIEAMGAGTLDTVIEVASEMSGRHLLKAIPFASGLKKALARRAVLKGWKPNRLAAAMQRGGFDGVIEEMLEERAGEVARGLTGLEKYQLPEVKQLLAEAIAFTVPGGLNAMAGSGKIRLNREQSQGLEQATQSAENDAELQAEIDAWVRESRIDPIIVDRLRQIEKEGRPPTRKEWASFGFPRFEVNQRRAVANAIIASRDQANTEQDEQGEAPQQPAEQPPVMTPEQVRAERWPQGDLKDFATVEQERQLWNTPRYALQFTLQDREKAEALAKSPTYLPKDFEDAGLPVPQDAATRRQWKTWLNDSLSLSDQEREALFEQGDVFQLHADGRWSRVPDGVAPPQSSAVELKETPFGNLIRVKPQKKRPMQTKAAAEASANKRAEEARQVASEIESFRKKSAEVRQIYDDLETSMREDLATPTGLARPAQKQQPSRPVNFVTAQGSRYVFENGTTTRHKAARPGHSDSGPKRPSEATYFVDAEKAREIGMWQTLQASNKRIYVENGQLVLTSRNAQTGKQGIDARIPIASEVPQIGLAPVELWDRSSQGENVWRANHPGSEITSIENEANDLAPPTGFADEQQPPAKRPPGKKRPAPEAFQTEPVATAQAAPSEVASQVLSAFPANTRVRISDLRAQFPGQSREQIDAALNELERAGHASIYRLDDPREITQADRDAALQGDAGPRHIVYITNQGKQAIAQTQAPAKPSKPAKPVGKRDPSPPPARKKRILTPKLRQILRDYGGEDKEQQARFLELMEEEYTVADTVDDRKRAIQAVKDHLWGTEHKHNARHHGNRQRTLKAWLARGDDMLGRKGYLSQFKQDEGQIFQVIESEVPGGAALFNNDINTLMDAVANEGSRQKLRITDDVIVERAAKRMDEEVKAAERQARLDEEADAEEARLEREAIQSDEEATYEGPDEWGDTPFIKSSDTIDHGNPPMVKPPRVKPPVVRQSGDDIQMLTWNKNIPREMDEAKAPPISEHGIVSTMERIFGLKFKIGRMNPRAGEAGGYYDVFREFVRQRGREVGDLGLATHELAHHIQKKYRMGPMLDEMKQSDPARHALIDGQFGIHDYEYEQGQARWFEGHAELLRLSLTHPDAVRDMAPAAWDWFENEVADQDLLDKLARVRSLITQWRDQGAANRIAASIISRSKSPHDPILTKQESLTDFVMSKLDLWYADWKDEGRALAKLSEMYRKGGYTGMTPYENYRAYAYTEGAAAQRAFEQGVYTMDDNPRRIGPGINEALLMIDPHAEFEEWGAWMHAMASEELAEKNPGYNPGVASKADRQAFIAKIRREDPAKAERYTKAHAIITAHHNAMLDLGASVGGELSEEMANASKEKYEFYVPKMRDMKYRNKNMRSRPGGGALRNRSPVRALSREGSGQPLLHPFVATQIRTANMYKYVHQQLVINSIAAGAREVEGVGGVVELNVTPKKILERYPYARILKQMVEDGILTKETALAYQAAVRFRLANGHADMKPSDMVRLGRMTQAPFPPQAGRELPAGWEERGETWGDSWETATWKHWQQFTEQEKQAVFNHVDGRIDSIPDIMQRFDIWKNDWREDPGDFIFVAYLDGKKTLIQVDPAIYRTLEGMGVVERGIVEQMFRQMTLLFKTFVTGISSAFGLRNLSRDYQTLQFQSKYTGKGEGLVTPLQWFARYAIHVVHQKTQPIHGLLKATGIKNVLFGLEELAKDEIIDLWESGGKVSTRYGLDVDSVRRRIEAGSRRGVLGKVKSLPGMAMNRVDDFRDLIGISEGAIRLAEFSAYLRAQGYVRKYDPQSKSYRIWSEAEQEFRQVPEDIRVRAINAAADSTIDFKRQGRLAKHVESYIPFFNAGLEGNDRQIRVILEAFAGHQNGTNPLTPEHALKLRSRLVYFTVASIAATVAYWMLRKDDDEYIVQADWLRNSHWTFRGGWRIPRDLSWNIGLPLIVEAALDDWFGNKARNKDRLLNAFIYNLERRNPIGSTFDKQQPAAAFVPSVPVVKSVAEVAMDWDIFRKQPIEGPALKNRLPKDRYNYYTSEASKWLGQQVGMSPAMIDHLFNANTGGFYGSVQQGTGSKYNPLRAPTQVFRYDRHYTDEINDFYEKAAELEKEVGSAKFTREDAERRLRLATQAGSQEDMDYWSKRIQKLGKEEEQARVEHRRFQRYTELMTEIRRDIVGEKDPVKRFEREKYLIGLARHALGKEELPTYPNPLRHSQGEVLDIMQDHIQKWLWSATAPGDTETRQSAREKLKDIEIDRQKAVQLLMRYGLESYRDRMRKRRPGQKVNRPPSAETRRERIRHLDFLR